VRSEAAPPEVLRPKAALSTAESEQTRMACYRTATDSHAEKSGCGAGGAGVAGGRVVSTAASLQTCVMWCEQI
jgi:hypothetical protein